MSNSPTLLPGKFLVFEGPDGCGKSTQLQKSAELIATSTGIQPLSLRSPGGSPLAEVVREQILSREGLPNEVRLYGMLLSMLSTTLELVGPALTAGRWVLMDRYLLSTVVYQGLLAGNQVRDIQTSIEGVFKNVGIAPDAYLVYNVSPETSLARINSRGEARTVFEKESLVRRMNPAYQFSKSLVSEPVFSIDGEGSIEEVWARTRNRVQSLLLL